jgi:hypothetical protein
VSARTLQALAAALGRAREPDDALREAVGILAEEPGIEWAAIAFVEGADLVVGPAAGNPVAGRRTSVPISFHGDAVGELWVDGEADPSFLARVAELLGPYVLIGWDTGGERWEP